MNGDFKNLGYRLQDIGDPSFLRCFRPTATSLANRLNELALAARTGSAGAPRLHGSYFEARLRRALHLADVAEIHVPAEFDLHGLPDFVQAHDDQE